MYEYTFHGVGGKTYLAPPPIFLNGGPIPPPPPPSDSPIGMYRFSLRYS